MKEKTFFQHSAFNDISQILQQMGLQWFPNLHKRMKVITAAVTLKVVGNEKIGGSGMRQTVPICLGPRRSRFVSLSILPSSLILSISVSAPVKQNE